MKKIVCILIFLFLFSVMTFVSFGCEGDNKTQQTTETEQSDTQVPETNGENDKNQSGDGNGEENDNTEPTDSGKWSPVIPLK